MPGQGRIQKVQSRPGVRTRQILLCSHTLHVFVRETLSDGPFFSTEPSAPPSNIRGHHSSSTRIQVEWEEVPQEHRNGDIQGYKVLYHDADGPKLEKTVNASTRQTSLTDLKASTAYTIKVLAFTSVGDGPASSGISVTTAEDSKCHGRC